MLCGYALYKSTIDIYIDTDILNDRIQFEKSRKWYCESEI